MKLRITGRTNGCVSPIKMGRIRIITQSHHSYSEGKEITFFCNIHDMKWQGKEFIATLVTDDPIEFSVNNIVSLTFIQNREQDIMPYAITEVLYLAEDNTEINITNKTQFIFKKKNWEIGEKDIQIATPPVHMPEIENAVEKSTPVSLEKIVESYQEERIHIEEYEQE